MNIHKIRSRTIQFNVNIPENWDLNVQLIMGKRYNYVIDTGLGSLHMAPVKEYLQHDNKPIIVVNTHYHWDHVWGNSSFPHSIIVAHQQCRDLIQANWDETIQKYSHFIRGEAQMVLPTLTFENEIYFPEDQIRLIHTPGHTSDGISVLDEVDKVLHAGDNIGDTMDDLVPNLACENSEYIQTLAKYDELDFEVCLSGHNVMVEKSIIDKIRNLL